MTAWLSNGLVSQRIVSSGFQGLEGILRELTRWETSSNIHSFHLMVILSANVHALSCQQHSSLEAIRTMEA